MSDARDRLKDALRAERQKAICGKDWYFTVTDKMDCDERTVRRWLAGETAPDFAQYLKLCELFGPAFETAVKGEPQATSTESDADVLSRIALQIRNGGMKP